MAQFGSWSMGKRTFEPSRDKIAPRHVRSYRTGDMLDSRDRRRRHALGALRPEWVGGPAERRRRRMKVFATDGCGFLGSHVCEYHVRNGACVISYDNMTKQEHADLFGLCVRAAYSKIFG
jgi:hypothetical protein